MISLDSSRTRACWNTMQAQLLLESPQAIKSKPARDGVFATLAACALRYGQLEAVAGAAVAALTRNEHLASGLAELAEFCEAKYHDERLVRPHAHNLQGLTILNRSSKHGSCTALGKNGVP